MKKLKVTIKEMTERLKVSPSIISRALQNHPNIEKKMTYKIYKLADKLGDYPNSLALNLRRNKIDLIGGKIPSVDRHFNFRQ